MPVYAKKVSTGDSRFAGRATHIYTGSQGTMLHSAIPIPDNIVLCNGCNSNQAETEKKEVFLIYLGKRELKADQPYDCYCESCLKRYFPKAEMM
jgi:hypothetical protein